jgi:hypothetical protein
MEKIGALAVVLVALASGCGGAESEPRGPISTRAAVEPVDLVAMRAEAASACAGSGLSAACPRLVPKAPYDPRSPIYKARVFPGEPGAPETFTLQWGGESRRPERNRPPRMAHLVVTSGALGFEVVPGDLRTGLVRLERPHGLLLDRPTWAGKRGQLVLAPPYPLGGIEGNHLAFLWTEGAAKYRVSLHAWEPLPEAVATLQAVVEFVPR